MITTGPELLSFNDAVTGPLQVQALDICWPYFHHGKLHIFKFIFLFFLNETLKNVSENALYFQYL